MSKLRVPVSPLARGRVTLDRATARYVSRVHRLARGQTFLAFDPETRLETDATIVSVGKGQVVCELLEPRPASLTAQRPLRLVLGLCKLDRFEWALREATALGATEITPVVCARSIVRATENSARRQERWNRITVEGARQCGRGDVPVVRPAVTFLEAMRSPQDEGILGLCLWERAARPLRELLLREPSGLAGVSVLIGPEGGLEQGEANAAREAGYSLVTLGPYVLRTETAVIVALGAVSVMLGESQASG